jgi:hypothetical protein
MSRQKLDLSGIKLDFSRKKRPVRDFKITLDPPSVVKKAGAARAVQRRPKSRTQAKIITGAPPPPNYKPIVFFLFFSITMFLFLFTPSHQSNVPVVNFDKGQALRGQAIRKMIRMKCLESKEITHCSTTQPSGFYVVAKGTCENIYELNGIVFTELDTDHNGNFLVPSSSDMSLRVKDACPSLIATVDTSILSTKKYAKANVESVGVLEKVVWVADNCFTEFTLKIGKEIIYEKTPTSMLDSVKLKNRSAFIFVPNVKISGAISIIGDCDVPLNIYTIRKT